MPGNQWDHGQPQERAIPTAPVLPDNRFSGLGTGDIPFRGGSKVLFILKITQGADFFVFLATNSLSSDGQLQCHFLSSTPFILAGHGNEENYGLQVGELLFIFN